MTDELRAEEFIMPMAKPEAARLIEAQILGQIRDGMALVNAELKDLSRSISDVKDRVIRIEAKDIEAKVAANRVSIDQNQVANDARIKVLELDVARYKGITTVLGVIGSATTLGFIGVMVRLLFKS